MKHSSLFSRLLLTLLLAIQADISKASEADDDFAVQCEPISETVYSNGSVYTVQKKCRFSKDIEEACRATSPDSIFRQCNVFDLKINSFQVRKDDSGSEYSSVLFKYSEGNDCSGEGSDLMFLSRCDTFASYVQFMRNNESGKCYAFVNSALLGRQLIEQSKRNSPGRIVQKVEIPGITSRILFVRSEGAQFASQSGSRFLKTLGDSTPARQPGPAVSPLHVLELEDILTVKPDNLKPNPAKIRISRGVGVKGDFFDIALGKKEEAALNKVLSECK